MKDEIQIIKRCLQGDVDAFGLLVVRYRDAMMRTAYHYLGSWEEAKDATQDAFIKAYLSLSQLDCSKKFSSWLFRILINDCLDKRRAARFKRENRLQEDRAGDYTDELSLLHKKEILRKSLQHLSSKYRRVIVLRDMEGFSTKEVAEILGIAESTVRVILWRARRKLKTIYTKLDQE